MVMKKINVHRNLSFPPPLFAKYQLLITPQELESSVQNLMFITTMLIVNGPEHFFRFSTQFLRRMVLFSTIRT